MIGPFDLEESTVAELPQTHGAYLLGFREGRSVMIGYVGRSKGLRRRLQEHVREGVYEVFYVGLTSNEVEAFFVECAEFHRYGKMHHLDNEIHPARPRGYKLSHCSVAGCQGEPD